MHSPLDGNDEKRVTSNIFSPLPSQFSVFNVGSHLQTRVETSQNARASQIFFHPKIIVASTGRGEENKKFWIKKKSLINFSVKGFANDRWRPKIARRSSKRLAKIYNFRLKIEVAKEEKKEKSAKT